MKKFTTILLSFSLILSCSTPTFARDNSEMQLESSDELMVDNFISFEPVSELEMYFDLIDASTSELKARGVTTKQINELKSINFEEGFLEQSKLPEEVLLNFGYTEEQVKLIKNYDGSPITRDSAMVKASATIGAGVTLNTSSTSRYKFTYSWVWTGKPISNGTDICAMRWSAYSSSGSPLGASIGTTDSSVEYYDFYGDLYEYETPSITEDDDSIYITFPLEKKDSNGDEYVWAKEGYLKATINKLGTSGMDFVRIRGAYGRSTSKVTPGISLSSSGVGFSFSPYSKITDYVDQAYYNQYGDYIGK